MSNKINTRVKDITNNITLMRTNFFLGFLQMTKIIFLFLNNTQDIII